MLLYGLFMTCVFILTVTSVSEVECVNRTGRPLQNGVI